MPCARRLLMTSDCMGGVWTYSLDLLRALQPWGWETMLAVVGPGPSEAAIRDWEDAVGGNGELVTLEGPLEWMAETPAEARRSGAALAGLAERFRPDLLHINAPALAADLPPTCPILAVNHSCVGTWHAAMHPGEPLPAELAWRHRLTRRGIIRADLVAAPSLAFARQSGRVHGRAEIIAVPNGRQPPARAARAEKDDCVLALGRWWDPAKQAEVIDTAAGMIGLPVGLAGPLEGPQGQRAELRHAEWLGMLGPGDVDRRLARRPIFVSAARYEPFGLAALEAAQHGCPLVLARIDTHVELWSEAALFFEPGSPGDLAGKVNALAADPAERERLGRLAAKRARSFSDRAMAVAYAAQYHYLIDGAGWRRRAT